MSVRNLRLPWRVLLAVLVGALVGMLVSNAMSHIERSGVRAASLTIHNETGFDEGPIREGISQVIFGRPLHVSVYIGPDRYDEDECYEDRWHCVWKNAPDAFGDGGHLRDDAVFVWINPETKFADASAPNTDYEHLQVVAEARRFASANLSADLLTDSFTANSVRGSLQLLADAESEVDTDGLTLGSSIPLLAGILTSIGVYLSLLALTQAIDARRQEGSPAALSRPERRAALASAREIFTDASHHLEEIELIALNPGFESYAPRATRRIAAWRAHYLDLAAAMFEASSYSDRHLISPRRAPLLARLMFTSRAVLMGWDHLKADEALLAGSKDHPTPDVLRRAIEAARTLSERTENPRLAHLADSMDDRLEKSERVTGTRRLEQWDRIAGRLASAAAENAEHAEHAPLLDDLEAAGLARGLSSREADQPALTNPLATNDYRDNLEEIRPAAPTSRTSLPPIAVVAAFVIAALIAITQIVVTAPPHATVSEPISTVRLDPNRPWDAPLPDSEVVATNSGQSVSRGLVTGFISFGLLLMAASVAAGPVRRRRYMAAHRREISSIMSTIHLSHDVLVLEEARLAKQYRYDMKARIQNWDHAVAQVQRALNDSSGAAGPDYGSKPGEVEANLQLVRLLRMQTESLWRIPTILDRGPGWADELEEEVRLACHMDPTVAERAAHAGRRVVTGTDDGMRGLLSLDGLALSRAAGQHWRALSAPSLDQLRATAKELSGLSAEPAHVRDDAYSRSDALIYQSTPRYAPSFFSLNTGFMEWTRGLWRYARESHAVRLAAKISPNIIWTVAVYVAVVIIVASIAFVYTLGTYRREAFDTDARPRSVTVIDDAEILGDTAEAQAQLAQIHMGVPLHLIIITKPDMCLNAWEETDRLDVDDPRLDGLVYSDGYGSEVVSGSAFICISPTNAALRSTHEIYLDMFNMRDALMIDSERTLDPRDRFDHLLDFSSAHNPAAKLLVSGDKELAQRAGL